MTSEELTQCCKSRGKWKRKAEAKEIQYQEVLGRRQSCKKPHKCWNISCFDKEVISIRYWKNGETMMKTGENVQAHFRF